MQINSNPNQNSEKFQRASPMNSTEEQKCDNCEQIIFEKEMYMICQVKQYGTGIKLKKFCIDCFEKKINDDIERIRKWSNKTVQELIGMIAPISDYLESETKKQIDANRKMLKKIEAEDGI
jgi:hypothetical protein